MTDEAKKTKVAIDVVGYVFITLIAILAAPILLFIYGVLWLSTDKKN